VAADAPPDFFLEAVLLVLDEATRTLDRQQFDERLGAQLARAAREQRGLAVLIVAADGVAWVNRRWGRAAGDSVLRKLARRLHGSVAPEDVFARYAANRFGIVRWAASAERAQAFALHLSGHVAGPPFEIPGGRDAAFLTISVGLTFTHPPGDAAAMVAAAEAALRRAKDAGGNRTCAA
jgi:diguanylate cyclase (GGDEF)-like protein